MKEVVAAGHRFRFDERLANLALEEPHKLTDDLTDVRSGNPDKLREAYGELGISKDDEAELVAALWRDPESTVACPVARTRVRPVVEYWYCSKLGYSISTWFSVECPACTQKLGAVLWSVID